MNPVKESNICEFPAWALGPKARRKLDIVWQQDTEPRNFRALHIDSCRLPNSRVWHSNYKGEIAQDRLDAFKSTLSNSTANGIETRKFRVTQDFVYGQANPEDKERNPYQPGMWTKSHLRSSLEGQWATTRGFCLLCSGCPAKRQSCLPSWGSALCESSQSQQNPRIEIDPATDRPPC
ncbi:hypothetical protein QBC42DRAFT_330808 [Cladorrhinum samala]|uniref:Uncharacterized protein n=1 Tax=Cladorrhinum samala TaxID=585594 RepID=A0AAV9I3K1_9PEZI|nr:hypothetical protein QBC42DRAFT_330808 [Cladorrhinum samala]